jgi:hypothetical protein
VHILELESTLVASLAGAELVGWTLAQPKTKVAASMAKKVEPFIALPPASNHNPLDCRVQIR